MRKILSMQTRIAEFETVFNNTADRINQVRSILREMTADELDCMQREFDTEWFPDDDEFGVYE